MGFASGTVSFRRFAVVGKQPKSIDQDLLDKLSEFALRPREEGLPDEEEYGWSGGRHILDGTFTFENNVFAECLVFGLRTDTNKIPGELKKAYQLMEEEAVAAGNPSGFISKKQKKDVKDTIQKKLDDDLRTGHFRRSKLTPILWDLAAKRLYCNTSGKTAEKLLEIFERTFGLELVALSAGETAMRKFESGSRKRDYEDLRPTRFVIGGDGESQYPEYPWVAKGPQPKDFLGNEFLLWLWHHSELNDGAIQTKAGEVTAYLDRSIDLDCAYGQSGKDFLRGEGVARSPEARDGLRSGKLPRKTNLILHANGQQYNFNFNCETLGIASAKLPEVEDAQTSRALFEERIALLRDLAQLVDNLFHEFLESRANTAWEGLTTSIRRWILQPTKIPALA